MTSYTPEEITNEAVKINNNANGNPRYYISVTMFRDDETNKFYRPQYCRKYTGKRYGAGWVFTSYSLENDIRKAMEDAA